LIGIFFFFWMEYFPFSNWNIFHFYFVEIFHIFLFGILS
jgi:hypothetical protein